MMSVTRTRKGRPSAQRDRRARLAERRVEGAKVLRAARQRHALALLESFPQWSNEFAALGFAI